MDLDRSSMNVTPEFFINQEIENSLNDITNELDRNYIYLLSLGSGGIKKILDAYKTFEIVKYLKQRYGFTPMIVSNPGQEFLQKELIDDFLEPSGLEYIRLDNKTVDEMAVIIKHSKFFIVPDTGLMHLAFALKTPVFCVFTDTHPLYVQPEDKDIIYQASYKIQGFERHRDPILPRCTKDIDFNEIKIDLDVFMDKLSRASSNA